MIPLTVGIILACGSYLWYTSEHKDLHLRITLENHPGSGDLVIVKGFSPDGSKVVTACVSDEDEVLAVWDTRSGQLQTSIRSDTVTSEDIVNDVDFLGFSPDGRVMAIGSAYDGVKFWDSTTWRAKRTIDIQDVRECHFVSENAVVLVAADSELTVWDLSTGQRMATLMSSRQETSQVVNARISADKRRLAAVIEEPLDNGRGARLLVLSWSTSTWQMQSWVTITLPQSIVVSISPDGRRMAGADDEGRVGVWDVETGRKRSGLQIRSKNKTPSESWYNIYAWAPDGESFLAVDNQGAMHLCDPEKRAVRMIEERAIPSAFTGHDPIFSFSVDGRVLFSISSREASRNAWHYNLPPKVQGVARMAFGKPRFWTSFQLRFENVAQGSIKERTLGNVSWITSARIHPAGSILAVSVPQTVSVPRGRILLYDMPKESERGDH